jgi:indolepyruvate ferredoxin oxidoreductase
VDSQISLDDKYTIEKGQIYLTGSQALVRLPLMQRRRDRLLGLDTAGFISGYRGSPMARYDLELWRAESFLDDHQIHFEPGVNEDLAATAVLGTQQVGQLAGSPRDGVFSIWYGKGPGVDRSGDALKHGAFAGASQYGGVLALAGDDHGCRSSTLPHQSDQAFIHYGMPVLNPASVQEFLELGLYGFALSRYSGCWIGFKCITDVVESSASARVDPERVEIALPSDFDMPNAGLNIRVGQPPLVAEEQLLRYRLGAAQAFVRVNGLDRQVLGGERRRLGLVTSGKAYLDVLQALDLLGLDEASARHLGISIYKVAMPWPLEPEGIIDFATGLEEIIVVEEKRAVIEDQLASLLVNLPAHPRLLGKKDERGAPLLPSHGELSPELVAATLRPRLIQSARAEGIELRAIPHSPGAEAGSSLVRIPSFCAGCPHNTSTRLPEGSFALGGIGCHGIAAAMPDRDTRTLYHMGGEGAAWIGQAPFTDTAHVFQNLGDGTYFHSGLLAIRANVAAGTNITYKILLNGVIAMTGGQPIEGASTDSIVTAPEIAWQVHSEGAKKVAVVADEMSRHEIASFPPGTEIADRSQLDRIQREMREVEGVTVIVYDQACAAETRRWRKKGLVEDPDLRVFINERVCEGCGDCGVQSNCIAIEPVETALGRKRVINQSSCNKDISCLAGLCPSFVTLQGATPRSLGGQDARPSQASGEEKLSALPPIAPVDISRPCSILVTGIGGTGVVTIGALLGMAAHLEGRGCSVLDLTGASQKNGSVMSHIRLAAGSEQNRPARIPRRGTDVLIGCDIVVSSSREALDTLVKGVTKAVVNQHVAPTSAFATNPNLDLSPEGMKRSLQERIGDSESDFLEATRIATALTGDGIATNLFLTGFALQRGWIPLGLDSIERAIELNGVAVEMNKQALAWGRLAAVDQAAVSECVASAGPRSEAAGAPESLETLMRRHTEILSDYQNREYARRYEALVDEVRGAERDRADGRVGLAEAVARSYFKLLTYKDEYEVARLYCDGQFREDLEAHFEGPIRVSLRLAPPLWSRRDGHTGRLEKRSFGPWIFSVLPLLARLKFLRGTFFDIFGHTSHRRTERRLIRDFEGTVRTLLESLTPETHDLAVEIAALPESIRGFDQVKELAVLEFQQRESELMAKLRSESS